MNQPSATSTSAKLEGFLRSHKLEFLYSSLTDIGLVEVSDFRFLTPDLIDTVEVMTQMPLIQRRKFEYVIETQRQYVEHYEELHRTERLKHAYSTKYETMKALVDTNKITEAEFDEWRHDEFMKTFNSKFDHRSVSSAGFDRCDREVRESGATWTSLSSYELHKRGSTFGIVPVKHPNDKISALVDMANFGGQVAANREEVNITANALTKKYGGYLIDEILSTEPDQDPSDSFRSVEGHHNENEENNDSNDFNATDSDNGEVDISAQLSDNVNEDVDESIDGKRRCNDNRDYTTNRYAESVEINNRECRSRRSGTDASSETYLCDDFSLQNGGAVNVDSNYICSEWPFVESGKAVANLDSNQQVGVNTAADLTQPQALCTSENDYKAVGVPVSAAKRRIREPAHTTTEETKCFAEVDQQNFSIQFQSSDETAVIQQIKISNVSDEANNFVSITSTYVSPREQSHLAEKVEVGLGHASPNTNSIISISNTRRRPAEHVIVECTDGETLSKTIEIQPFENTLTQSSEHTATNLQMERQYHQRQIQLEISQGHRQENWQRLPSPPTCAAKIVEIFESYTGYGDLTSTSKSSPLWVALSSSGWLKFTLPQLGTRIYIPPWAYDPTRQMKNSYRTHGLKVNVDFFDDMCKVLSHVYIYGNAPYTGPMSNYSLSIDHLYYLDKNNQRIYFNSTNYLRFTDFVVDQNQRRHDGMPHLSPNSRYVANKPLAVSVDKCHVDPASSSSPSVMVAQALSTQLCNSAQDAKFSQVTLGFDTMFEAPKQQKECTASAINQLENSVQPVTNDLQITGLECGPECGPEDVATSVPEFTLKNSKTYCGNRDDAFEALNLMESKINSPVHALMAIQPELSQFELQCDNLKSDSTHKSDSTIHMESLSSSAVDRIEDTIEYSGIANCDHAGGFHHGESICDICCNMTAQFFTEKLLTCKSCYISVHPSCYRLTKFPRKLTDSTWLCDACTEELVPSNLPCALCSFMGGAYYSSDLTNHWVHAQCALLIPNTVKSSCCVSSKNRCDRKSKSHTHDISVTNVDSRRFGLKCGICQQKNTGACIQCFHGRCSESIHPRCLMLTLKRSSNFEPRKNESKPSSSISKRKFKKSGLYFCVASNTKNKNISNCQFYCSYHVPAPSQHQIVRPRPSLAQAPNNEFTKSKTYDDGSTKAIKLPIDDTQSPSSFRGQVTGTNKSLVEFSKILNISSAASTNLRFEHTQPVDSMKTTPECIFTTLSDLTHSNNHYSGILQLAAVTESSGKCCTYDGNIPDAEINCDNCNLDLNNISVDTDSNILDERVPEACIHGNSCKRNKVEQKYDIHTKTVQGTSPSMAPYKNEITSVIVPDALSGNLILVENAKSEKPNSLDAFNRLDNISYNLPQTSPEIPSRLASLSSALDDLATCDPKESVVITSASSCTSSSSDDSSNEDGDPTITESFYNDSHRMSQLISELLGDNFDTESVDPADDSGQATLQVGELAQCPQQSSRNELINNFAAVTASPHLISNLSQPQIYSFITSNPTQINTSASFNRKTNDSLKATTKKSKNSPPTNDRLLSSSSKGTAAIDINPNNGANTTSNSVAPTSNSMHRRIGNHAAYIFELIKKNSKESNQELYSFLASHPSAVNAVHRMNGSTRGSNKVSALVYACTIENDMAIKYLLHYGADVNQIGDSKDNRPLHIVSKKRNVVLVMEFVRAGGDIYLTNKRGRRPIDYITSKFMVEEMVKLYNIRLQNNSNPTDVESSEGNIASELLSLVRNEINIQTAENLNALDEKHNNMSSFKKRRKSNTSSKITSRINSSQSAPVVKFDHAVDVAQAKKRFRDQKRKYVSNLDVDNGQHSIGELSSSKFDYTFQVSDKHVHPANSSNTFDSVSKPTSFNVAIGNINVTAGERTPQNFFGYNYDDDWRLRSSSQFFQHHASSSGRHGSVCGYSSANESRKSMDDGVSSLNLLSGCSSGKSTPTSRLSGTKSETFSLACAKYFIKKSKGGAQSDSASIRGEFTDSIFDDSEQLNTTTRSNEDSSVLQDSSTSRSGHTGVRQPFFTSEDCDDFISRLNALKKMQETMSEVSISTFLRPGTLPQSGILVNEKSCNPAKESLPDPSFKPNAINDSEASSHLISASTV